MGCKLDPSFQKRTFGGVSRAIFEPKEYGRLEYHATLTNLVMEFQVPVVAAPISFVILRARNYSCALHLAVLCAIAAWLGSCYNAFTWSPGYLNCRSERFPGTNDLGPGIVTQALCSVSFNMFAVRRLLLLERVVDMHCRFRIYLQILVVVGVMLIVIAVVVGGYYGPAFAASLYYIASSLNAGLVAMTIALFSKAFQTLRSADVSEAGAVGDATAQAMKVLKRELSCISLTLLTSFACIFYTGSVYLNLMTHGRLLLSGFKYNVYSFDTMVNACCFAYLSLSSEQRLVGFNKVQHTSDGTPDA